MRRAVPAAAAALLLAGPTVLAFFSGGYFAEPRLIAALVAWAFVLALTLLGADPLPRSGAGRAAFGGLALIAIWSAVSLAWAPLGGPAIDNVERLVLYAGALLVAIGVLRERRLLAAVEPALAAGATVVIGYGLAGRLLPGVVHLSASRSAGGRLEQPITYWNGEGALAAIGLVLCARIAGDRSRSVAMRAAAAAAVAVLGAGVYLSYSRGAIAVALLGLVVLVAACPTRTQLVAAAGALVVAPAAGAVSSAFPGVASLAGSQRSRDGAIALVILAVLALAAALATARIEIPDTRLRSAGRLKALAVAAAVVVAAGLLVGGLSERPTAAELAAGASAARLTTVSSDRYEYWRVALRTFAHHPIAGVGSGGFRVEWLRERTIVEAVKETHSIEFEMAAELGVIGLLAFALFVGGTAVCAARALRRHPALAAGPAAGAVVWLGHASIDWDWQLPAVTLPAIALAGALVALAETTVSPER